MSTFERESIGLLAAIEGRPVDWADVHVNYDLKKQTAASANHRLGSNPAWGLDAFRRGDQRIVADVLDWSAWLVGEPLHENEGLTPHPAYRTRIDTGTRALALAMPATLRQSFGLSCWNDPATRSDGTSSRRTSTRRTTRSASTPGAYRRWSVGRIGRTGQGFSSCS